jgi:hypothetical protein
MSPRTQVRVVWAAWWAGSLVAVFVWSKGLPHTVAFISFYVATATMVAVFFVQRARGPRRGRKGSSWREPRPPL